MKILIVEDDKHLNKAICEMLKNIAETYAIYNGEDALYAVEQNIYDLIILDVMLPKKNGYEILKEIFGEKIYIIN
jgi:two-component system response regulator CiaR